MSDTDVIETDYLIIGAGQAGLTLARLLTAGSVTLLDPSAGGYKIGESIVPEQFQHPELKALLPAIHDLPSYTPKSGVTFVSADTVASFPLLPKNRRESMHVARAELERLMLEAWALPVRAERVRSIDPDAGRVITDGATYQVAKQIIDCSGAAMVVATALGEVESLRPVHATWAYFDVVSHDDARFRPAHTAAGRRVVHYDARRRQILPDLHLDGWSPSHTTTLTHVEPGTWCWQIPLFGGSRLSFGVVSRAAPVSEDRLLEIAEAFGSPCYELRRAAPDPNSPYGRVHHRSGFARRARRAASSAWILLGDAFSFADPVYSIGTALAVNRAIDVARQLNGGGWTDAACEGYCRGAEAMAARADEAFEFWYTGEVLTEDAAAAEVHDGFLVGRAFGPRSLEHYGGWLEAASLRSGRHRDDTQRVDPQRAPVREPVVALLGGAAVAGWHLDDARVCTDGLYLSWTRDDHPELIMLALVDPDDDMPHFKRVGAVGLSYMSRWTGAYAFDDAVAALFDAVADAMTPDVHPWVALHAG